MVLENKIEKSGKRKNKMKKISGKRKNKTKKAPKGKGRVGVK
jgi:hypothetical protein